MRWRRAAPNAGVAFWATERKLTGNFFVVPTAPGRQVCAASTIVFKLKLKTYAHPLARSFLRAQGCLQIH